MTSSPPAKIRIRKEWRLMKPLSLFDEVGMREKDRPRLEISRMTLRLISRVEPVRPRNANS